MLLAARAAAAAVASAPRAAARVAAAPRAAAPHAARVARRPMSTSSATPPGGGGGGGGGPGFLSSAGTLLRLLHPSNLRKHAYLIAGVSGGLVVVWGLSSVAYYVTTTVLTLRPEDYFLAGAGTGLVAALTLGAGGVWGYRQLYISTQAVHRVALARLARSPAVRASLGGGLRSGSLRAYTLYPGHVSVGKGFGWVEPRAQMLFQLVGDKGEGMATVEAVQHRGRAVPTLLAVDVLARPPGSPGGATQPTLILVAGDEAKLHVRGTLRGFLTAERAQYIAQDAVASDEDRLREQSALPEEEEPVVGAAAAEGGGGAHAGDAAGAGAGEGAAPGGGGGGR
jgi:hypothetical protein